jgi:predicted flap endonuclease-1-like 5' DNA nuclease
MSDHVGTLRATLLALAFAALLGAVTVVLLMVLGGFDFSPALFLGTVLAVVVGGLIAWIFTRPLPTMAEIQARHAASGTTVAAAPAHPAPAPAPAPAAAAPAPAPAATAPASAPAAAPPAPTQPKLLSAPEGGAPDDLKRIRGIGPKLEEMLHRMGIYHFQQIASWSPSELAWVDENLGDFKGRASRDDWVGQAKILAAGGTIQH